MFLSVFGLVLDFVGILSKLRFDPFNPASCSLASVADFDYVQYVSRVLNSTFTQYYKRAFQESWKNFGDVSVSDSFRKFFVLVPGWVARWTCWVSVSAAELWGDRPAFQHCLGSDTEQSDQPGPGIGSGFCPALSFVPSDQQIDYRRFKISQQSSCLLEYTDVQWLFLAFTDFLQPCHSQTWIVSPRIHPTWNCNVAPTLDLSS